MPKRSSKHQGPTDLNELAARIAGEATSEAEPTPPLDEPEKNPHAVALGRMGGKKGGEARASKLTAEQRREIAKKAAAARWSQSTLAK